MGLQLGACNSFAYVVVTSIIHGNSTIFYNFHFLFQLPSQSRNKTSPPTSQSLYYQSHSPSVLSRDQPVTATASVPTTERFSSEYENISSLSPGPHTMNPLMYRHEPNPPEKSSRFRYSMYGDHGVSSMPYASSTQHETPSYDPVQWGNKQ